MADKTLNELQLIDEVTENVNFLGDDTIQTYRLTANQIKAFVNESVNERIDEIVADDWVTRARMANNAVGFNEVALKNNFLQAKGSSSFFIPSKNNWGLLTDTTKTITIPSSTPATEWGFMVNFGAVIELLGASSLELGFCINSSTPDADKILNLYSPVSDLELQTHVSKSIFFTLDNSSQNSHTFSLRAQRTDGGFGTSGTSSPGALSGLSAIGEAHYEIFMFRNIA